MKIREIKGTTDVFRFTLFQMLKSKGLILTMIFMILFALCAYPVKMLLDRGNDEDTVIDFSVDKLYVLDESTLHFLDWFRFEDAGLMKKTKPVIVKETRDYDTVVEELKTTKEKVALLRIRQVAEEGSIYLTLVRGANSDVSKSDMEEVIAVLPNAIHSQLVKHMNVTQEQMEMLNLRVDTDTVYLDLNAAPEQPGEPGTEDEVQNSLSLVQYTLTIATLCVTIMLVSLCAEYIGSAIVMEKSSKVVEFLLTSVRPLALLLGKVFAVMLIVLLQMVALLLAFVVSVFAYHLVVDVGSLESGVTALKELVSSFSDISIQVQHILIIIPLIICGVLFYSMIGGIIAAGVKSVEELQEGMKTFTMCLFIGAYGSMFIMIFDLSGGTPDIIRIISYFLPFTSVFILPGYLVIGKAKLWMACVGLAITILSIGFMFRFAARVYEYLIYYRGKKLKLRDYFRIYKQEKGGKNHE